MAKTRFRLIKPRPQDGVPPLYWLLSGLFWFLILALLGSVPALYFTKRDFAMEVKQVRQPRPNRFYIGIDISQTIKPEMLSDFEDALIVRLRDFVGHDEVYYQISIFGLPGCGEDAIADILQTQSPKDAESFEQTVADRIRAVSIADRAGGEDDMTPLTTPLFFFLERVLTEWAGERVVIFSDLVNDDKGCQNHSLPLETIEQFGLHKGQIIFLCPTPHVIGQYDTPDLPERLVDKQRSLIKEIQELTSQGKVRAFFYHVPEDPQKREGFLKSHLQKAIPATTFQIVWERVSRMIDTIVVAVRG
jgi:hypothetical protein